MNNQIQSKEHAIQLIKDRLKEVGMTQYRLAQLINKNKATVHTNLNMKYPIKWEMIFAMCEVLEIKVKFITKKDNK